MHYIILTIIYSSSNYYNYVFIIFWYRAQLRWTSTSACCIGCDCSYDSSDTDISLSDHSAVCIEEEEKQSACDLIWKVREFCVSSALVAGSTSTGADLTVSVLFLLCFVP